MMKKMINSPKTVVISNYDEKTWKPKVIETKALKEEQSLLISTKNHTIVILSQC